MSKPNAISGKCLCGAVQLTTNRIDDDLGACHCSMCRKWGGGPLMAIDCGAEVSLNGDDNVSIFDSSKWAERGFCNNCGSHLFYRLKDTGQYFVPIGLFDEELDAVFTSQVFIDEKPAYYAFANETKNMTGAEIFAMYST